MEPTEFKMEDFMDVVYKCKFCPYSCTHSMDMGLHVKEKHLKQPSFSPPEKNPGSSFIYNVGNSAHLTIPQGGVLTEGDKSNINIQVSDDVLSFTSAEGQACMDKSLPRAIPVSRSSSLTQSSESNSDLTELMSMVKDKSSMLENQAHSLGLEPVVQLSESVPVSSFTSTSSSLLHSGLNHPSSQSMSVMAIQLPSLTDSNSSQFIVQTNDNQVSLAMNESSETKEYLLCGLCKLAFTSMEDCQSHMQTEHRELMQGAGVSIGVQVGGGKRGRKRKSDIANGQATMKIKEEPDHDTDDIEWLPTVPDESQTTHRDGRFRQKVIPPKALKEDYVLGRRVVKKRQRSSNNYLGYNVMCPMMSCKARFKTKQSMEIHFSSHNPDDASFTCPQCQASHDFWKHLRIHLWKVHRIDVDLLTCDSCDYKTDTVHKMNIHREIHTDSKPYKCTICNKGFRQAAQQKNHMTIHRNPSTNPESNQWFSSKKCDICERTFANSKCLAKHKEAVHAKLKPYQCSFCGHTTARKAMMELHIRTHTGEKPFKCDVCSYTTGDHNSLRRHKMRHSGEKQYRCSLCPYTCIQSISLKQHIKNKHPGANSGIFQCTRCPFRSINQSHFDSHMLDHKKGLIPDVAVTVKVNETKPKKPTHKQQSGNAKQKGVTLQNGVESLFHKHPQFHTIIPGESTPQSTLEAIGVGPSAGHMHTEVFNMQVTVLAGGDTQVSAEDMAKLSESPNLMALGISPLQLIYATLSTISEQADMSCVEEGRSSLLTLELVGGIQTSVLSSIQDGTITHSITYHFPVITAPQTSSADKDSSEGEGIATKIQPVINTEDIEVLEKSHPSSSSTLSLSALPLPLQTSSIMIPSLIGSKENVKEEKVNVEGFEAQSNALVSSSFLTPSFSSGYISLVGASMKTETDQGNLPSQEEEEELNSNERSVFLIEDGDLVEKSGNAEQNVDEEQDESNSLVVLGGKGMEITDLGDGSVVNLPKSKNAISNTSVNSLTSLINTDQNLTMINGSASDIVHLIPISFLDQNGQELSTAQTFIPSSN